MFHVILVNPEIPPNTGNAIRLCANTGSHLHIIRPFSFSLDDRRLKRAGLDYHEWQEIKIHNTLQEAIDKINVNYDRCFVMTTKGNKFLSNIHLYKNDVFIFGNETKGLSTHYMNLFPETNKIRLPMLKTQRSLNLSNAIAITIYEAWRQNNYINGI
ncbi:tRNA (cytidine(34)-2'-O)-methyltransferase [Candidatus Kinetoplastibacterium sorsogonicusi]|uniref:tRNA (cytidine(34)-2'-O)-methyltransferase n=1 Tax=Candidatus Kinetoplastidibacterium kentomonadis TaxID=1576550 RepID=A0A3S7JAK2_9PROT|nr:tRNA (cytidine(34)-2'-O)-methyltransferase [Candidatus Kinetoplastibacterium sorsogonicusi]AWD32712.1 tRNA (cytidine(34)-2'-O)-methyltransferase [Candidatus Kinetoplastibacterium sorsogonicusi]